MLSLPHLLWLSVGLQFATVLLCRLVAEARGTGSDQRGLMPMSYSLPFTRYSGNPHVVVAQFTRRGPANRGHRGSAIIERDAA